MSAFLTQKLRYLYVHHRVCARARARWFASSLHPPSSHSIHPLLHLAPSSSAHFSSNGDINQLFHELPSLADPRRRDRRWRATRNREKARSGIPFFRVAVKSNSGELGYLRCRGKAVDIYCPCAAFPWHEYFWDTSMHLCIRKGTSHWRALAGACGRMPSNPGGFDPPRNPQINGSQGRGPAWRIERGRSPCSAFSRDLAAAAFRACRMGDVAIHN